MLQEEEDLINQVLSQAEKAKKKASDSADLLLQSLDQALEIIDKLGRYPLGEHSSLQLSPIRRAQLLMIGYPHRVCR